MIHMIDCPEPVLANDHVSSRNDIVFEREVFSLCLSRACLGKKIALLYIYIWRKKPVFAPGQAKSQPSQRCRGAGNAAETPQPPHPPAKHHFIRASQRNCIQNDTLRCDSYSKIVVQYVPEAGRPAGRLHSASRPTDPRP